MEVSSTETGTADGTGKHPANYRAGTAFKTKN